jgi:cytochrome c oxidase cbb3-type subunit 2
VGGKYTDDWHRLHLLRPRDLVPETNMPNYPWLAERKLDGRDIEARMRALRLLGDPYTDADIDGARDAVEGKTELDALVAYLQGLGVSNRAPVPAEPAP